MVGRTSSAVLIAGLMTACARAPTSLAELDDPVLVVRLGEMHTREGLFALVEVTVRHARSYAVLTTPLDGTLDGAGLEVLSRGEAPGSGVLSFGVNPSLRAVVPFGDAARSTLVVSDHTATFSVTVAAMLAPRSIAVAQPADGVLHLGQRVEVAFAPESDALDLGVCGVQFVRPRQWDLGGCSRPGLAVQTARGRFGFTMPRTIPEAPSGVTDAVLNIEVDRRPQVVECVGVTRCEVVGRWTDEAPVRLAVP